MEEGKYIKKIIHESPIDFGEIGADYLAGGAITSIFSGNPINDFDLYFKSEENFKKCLNRLEDQGLFLNATERSVTFVTGNSDIYQLMHFDYFERAEDIFEAFDFSVCMGCLDFEKDKIITHKDFLIDIAGRKLNLVGNTRYPFATLLRVKKYEEKGYSIDNKNLLKVAYICSLLSINTWDELKTAMAGYYGLCIKEKQTSLEFNLENIINFLDEIEFEKYSDKDVGETSNAILNKLKKIKNTEKGN